MTPLEIKIRSINRGREYILKNNPFRGIHRRSRKHTVNPKKQVYTGPLVTLKARTELVWLCGMEDVK